jgi:5-methylcytosine-specific restriction endonuclease McrA
MTKPCAHCGQNFNRTSHSNYRWTLAQFCSRLCASKHRRGRAYPKVDATPRQCENCGVTFERGKTTSHAAWQFQKYCGRKCTFAARQGTPAHNKGVPGKPWTAERRQRLAERVADNVLTVRTERWSGGTWQRIRQYVLKRDDCTCSVCGLREPEIMTVDHKVPRALAPHLMYDPDNTITLCPNDHARKTIVDRVLIKAARMSPENVPMDQSVTTVAPA